MKVFTPLNEIIFGDKSILLAVCETIINPEDSQYSSNMSTFVDYCIKYNQLTDVLLWCYEHDYEFGYDNQYQQFFNNFFADSRF